MKEWWQWETTRFFSATRKVGQLRPEAGTLKSVRGWKDGWSGSSDSGIMNTHHIQKMYTTIPQRNKTRFEKMKQMQAVLYIPVHESPSFPCIHPPPFTIFKCLLCCCHCLVNISQWGRRYTGYYLCKGGIVLARKETLGCRVLLLPPELLSWVKANTLYPHLWQLSWVSQAAKSSDTTEVAEFGGHCRDSDSSVFLLLQSKVHCPIGSHPLFP